MTIGLQKNIAVLIVGGLDVVGEVPFHEDDTLRDLRRTIRMHLEGPAHLQGQALPSRYTFAYADRVRILGPQESTLRVSLFAPCILIEPRRFQTGDPGEKRGGKGGRARG